MRALARPHPRHVALLILAVAGATIAGALASQHVFGLAPCKLCLQQRWPYYLALPLAAATALVPGRWLGVGLALLALLFLTSAGLGAYHAGVEWGLFAGPSDCGGGLGPTGSVADLLQGLEREKVVSCTKAAWRFLGLSLAGWNALISLGVAVTGGWAATELSFRPRIPSPRGKGTG